MTLAVPTAAATLLVGGPAKAAPKPISSLPFTISQPGADALTGNLTYSGSLDAILITASNVTLTGGGYTLTGPGSSGSATGIHVSAASQVTITGARLTGFNTGIRLEAANFNTLTTNTANNNFAIGIELVTADSSTLHGNITDSNGSSILANASNSNVLDTNTASSNPVGIDVSADSPGNTLVHNTAQGNTMLDLEDDGLSPCQNGWANNLYVTDNEMGLAAGPMFGCIR